MIQYLIETFLKLIPSQSWGVMATGIAVPIGLHVFQAIQRTGISIKHDHKLEKMRQQAQGATHTVRWKIWNCGKVPIRLTDFNLNRSINSIIFTFGVRAEVTAARIVATYPKDLTNYLPPPPIPGPSNNQATLDPISLTLNQRSSITFDFYVKDPDPENIRVYLPISGNPPIDVTAERKKAVILFNIVIILFLVWIFIHFSPIFLPSQFFSTMYIISLIVVFLIFLLATINIILYINTMPKQ